MDFPRIKRLPPYVFNAIGELCLKARRAGEDIIDFGMGNPDEPTPPHIVAKLVEAAAKGANHRYSVSRGVFKLRLAICDWYRRRYGVELDPDSEAIVTMGSKEGIGHLVLAMLGPGDVVFCPSPTYPIHQYSVIIAGGDLRSIPLMPGGDFLGLLQEAVRTTWPKPKLLILNFPHNPTTEVVDLDFFRGVVEFAREHECLVVHDLAYADLCFDGYVAPSFLRVPGGLRGRQPRDHRRARSHQELPRLRHLPAGADRGHPRAHRPAALRRGDLRGLPQAPRRALRGPPAHRLAGAEAEGHHVRLGRGTRRL